MTPAKFRNLVWKHHREGGRHALPWRKTKNPYQILVSEVMLQQTRVERVVPFYQAFLKKFPDAQQLAQSPLSEVLKAWQGLGYNRRAKMLHQTAKEITTKYHGRMPKRVSELESLPCIGPYTARAIVAFAYDQDVILVETNIRTAVVHHFFPKKKKISDAEIVQILERALPKGSARAWYAALMDYGAYLKRIGINLNAKSPRYVQQKQFKGSVREARGAILRELSKEQSSKSKQAFLINLFGNSRRTQVQRALNQLTQEGLVTSHRGTYTLSN